MTVRMITLSRCVSMNVFQVAFEDLLRKVYENGSHFFHASVPQGNPHCSWKNKKSLCAPKDFKNKPMHCDVRQQQELPHLYSIYWWAVGQEVMQEEGARLQQHKAIIRKTIKSDCKRGLENGQVSTKSPPMVIMKVSIKAKGFWNSLSTSREGPAYCKMHSCISLLSSQLSTHG